MAKKCFKVHTILDYCCLNVYIFKALLYVEREFESFAIGKVKLWLSDLLSKNM